MRGGGGGGEGRRIPRPLFLHFRLFAPFFMKEPLRRRECTNGVRLLHSAFKTVVSLAFLQDGARFLHSPFLDYIA